MRRPLLFFAVLGAALRPAPAQEPLELTLRGALRLAADQGAESRAADERVAQVLARIDPARGALTPQVAASVSAARQTRNLETVGIPLSPAADPLIGPFNTYDARLRVTQTLFDAAAVRRLEAARRGRDLAEADRVRAREDLLALAARTYVEARRSEGAAALAGRAEDLARARAALARERAAVGTATTLDADRADRAEVEARIILTNAELSRDQARRDLLGVLALPEGAAVRFGDDPLPSGDPGPRLDPDARAAQAQVEAGRAELSAARGDEAPKASLSADYGFTGIAPSDLRGTYTLGAQGSWALFDGRQRRGRRQELESRVRESAVRAEDAARRTDRTLAQAEASARAARELVAARSADERLAGRLADLARERADLGTATALDAREADFNRARALDAREEAEALLWTAEIARRRALGRMEDFLK